MVSLIASFVLSFFPLDVLDEIWDLIVSVSEGFLTYSFLSSSSTVLVFLKKHCDPFLQNKGFYARGKSLKSAFSIDRHYNVGSKMMQN